MTSEHIALAFRIPLQILGLGSAPFGSTSTLMQFWLASGLGFALNHVEQAFDKFFGLAGQPDEYVEFDTAALLRSDQKDRIDALVRGVQGGIYSPNEARNQEGYDNVPYGDEPRLQAQVVPLSAAKSIPAADTAPAAPAASAVQERQARVRREFDAMTARVKRPALNGANKPVIRKTKMNGLQHAVNLQK